MKQSRMQQLVDFLKEKWGMVIEFKEADVNHPQKQSYFFKHSFEKDYTWEITLPRNDAPSIKEYLKIYINDISFNVDHEKFGYGLTSIGQIILSAYRTGYSVQVLSESVVSLEKDEKFIFYSYDYSKNNWLKGDAKGTTWTLLRNKLGIKEPAKPSFVRSDKSDSSMDQLHGVVNIPTDMRNTELLIKYLLYPNLNKVYCIVIQVVDVPRCTITEQSYSIKDGLLECNIGPATHIENEDAYRKLSKRQGLWDSPMLSQEERSIINGIEGDCHAADFMGNYFFVAHDQSAFYVKMGTWISVTRESIDLAEFPQCIQEETSLWKNMIEKP